MTRESIDRTSDMHFSDEIPFERREFVRTSAGGSIGFMCAQRRPRGRAADALANDLGPALHISRGGNRLCCMRTIARYTNDAQGIALGGFCVAVNIVGRLNLKGNRACVC